MLTLTIVLRVLHPVQYSWLQVYVLCSIPAVQYSYFSSTYCCIYWLQQQLQLPLTQNTAVTEVQSWSAGGSSLSEECSFFVNPEIEFTL